MKDPRIGKLARTLVNYSCKVQPGDHVLVDTIGKDHTLAQALVDEIYEAGGVPFVEILDAEIERKLLPRISRDTLAEMAERDAARMSRMQAYIGIRASQNIFEMRSVPDAQMQLYQEIYYKPVHLEIRVKKTRWCILRYPNYSMAQLARMSTEDFEDFYFNVCNLDYTRLSAAMDALVDVMAKTDRVEIRGPGTDLTFSIKGLPPIKCDGTVNIPDGEVFTAPVKDSVQGTITYNTPSPHQGVNYENVSLTFKDGKIVKATCSNDTPKLNIILDIDEGARYVGEFAFGVNPYILQPMNDILFDEKISGSIHFTPGASYEECSNGNDSALHWDLVLIQRPEFGGGEIWFDGRLIRKDGLFVVDELKGLNPEALLAPAAG